MTNHLTLTGLHAAPLTPKPTLGSSAALRGLSQTLCGLTVLRNALHLMDA